MRFFFHSLDWTFWDVVVYVKRVLPFFLVSGKTQQKGAKSAIFLNFTIFISSPGLYFSSVSVIRPSTFHILIFSSETTGPIATKLLWNDPWKAPFQNCVRWSRLPTKMDAKLKIEKRGMKLKQNLLLWNYWANLNQTLLKWSLGGPLSKLCPSAPSCIQDGRHY